MKVDDGFTAALYDVYWGYSDWSKEKGKEK